MSSFSKAQFIAELKTRSGVIATFTDEAIGSFVDIALRAYSRFYPELLVSVDNDVDDMTESGLYEMPEGALSITKIVDSDSRKEIAFQVESQGEDDEIRLGEIIRPSYSDLLENTYYDNPLASASSTQVTSYEAFDIEYTILQDMDTIKDSSLEAVADYVEYLACNNKAGAVAVGAVDSSERIAEQITDQDSTGASTTIKYASSKEMATTLKQQANEALERFKDAQKNLVYGVRS